MAADHNRSNNSKAVFKIVATVGHKETQDMDSGAEVHIRSLEDIWPAQAELNKRAGFDTSALGMMLISASADDEKAATDPTLVVGRAIKNYIDAMVAECHELQECLSWKHWYREAREGRQYELRDIQNARVEAIYILFFWVSICQLLGLKPADIYRLYGQKLQINQKRQDEARCQADHGKFEHENKDVI